MKKHEIIKTRTINNVLTERKILSCVDNPFIIKLHHHFQDEDKVYLAFDYHNGGELFFHLQKQKRFDEETVKFFAAELFHGLQYLHSEGILYRDIKPENIILTDEGHLKLIDFGLAKMNVSSTNLASTFCGTNEYLPPEAVQGQKYGFSFDWWGFAALIYELIYGTPAFYEKTKLGIYKKIVNGEPNYEKYKVSDDLVDFLKKMLQKDVKNRMDPKDIPFHPWFKNVDFGLVKSQKFVPPFLPATANKLDFCNIDKCFLREEVPCHNACTEMEDDEFFDDIFTEY